MTNGVESDGVTGAPDPGELIPGLVEEIGRLCSAIRDQTEALELLGGGTDQSISGDTVLFRSVPALRSRASVVIRADLFAELAAAGHPATQNTGHPGQHTISDVCIEDEGRGWLRLYELADEDCSKWDLLVPLNSIEAVFSHNRDDDSTSSADDGWCV